MNLASTTPFRSYTYLIGWSKLNTWYYGSRCANKTEPRDDLWVRYFTSSSIVKQFRERNGEPDVIRIHRQFDDRLTCLYHEHRVLRRVCHKPNFLNATDNINFHKCPNLVKSDAHKRNISKSLKGLKKSKEQIELMSRTRKGKKWITNGIVTRWISSSDYVPDGWRLGKHTKGIPKPKFKWITNGVLTTKQFDLQASPPAGWYFGSSSKSTSGKVWITDGVLNKLVEPSNIPQGWLIGRVENSNKDSIWITDGIRSMRIPKQNSIPEGWIKGRKGFI